MSTTPTILIVPSLFGAVIAFMILAFLLRHLRNRGDLEWLGLGIIDEEEEGRREEAMTRAMRARILGLVGEVMGRDTDMEATPLVKPELDEVELHLEGGAGEGRMKEWSPLSIRRSSVPRGKGVDHLLQLSVLIVGPREQSPDARLRPPPSAFHSLGYRSPTTSNEGEETLDSFAPVLELGTVVLRTEEP
ncbi:hypothetical protein BDY24DRAFT_168055 [Mrakia frigida]|uniref:uncharacterized protein n=1 Tax=Mrakia frigida TaxID=29902 RepID=UPI003FCBFAB0